jgi:uncharacterized protein YegL
MTQKDFETEDTVICLDVSRSMARKDFGPSRLEAAKKALGTFLRKKHEIDKDDRYALVIFSTNAKIVQELTKDPDQIINVLKGITPQGISSLGEGLGVALHVVSDQIMKQGSNINRIIVISDGKPWLGTIDPLEKARIMGEVGVLVDTIALSSKTSRGNNILESISILGEYHQVADSNLLEMTLSSLSHKKDVFELKKTMPKLSLIAADLLNPAELTEEILSAINYGTKPEGEKCLICRTSTCNICKRDDCGRLCPYCKNFLHLCCALKWSEESKMAEANVFRCPHCLFLLRFPEDMSTRIPVRGEGESTPEQQVPENIQGPKGEPAIKSAESELKSGDFFLEHGQVKLITKFPDGDKTIYLSWENWGSRDFNCNIVAGMNEIVCKEFSPKINWVDRACLGFTLKDTVGWFSQPSLEHGIFRLDLVQFENWCKIVQSDVEYIKKLLAQHPEIQFESDMLVDFVFTVDVNYKKAIDTTDRNKLDQRLLEDAVLYLKLLRTRPYSKISVDKRLEVPKTPIATAGVIGESGMPAPSPQVPAQGIISVQPSSPDIGEISVTIENPYTGKPVEIPKTGSQERDIGTAKTLAIPKSAKPAKKIQEMPKVELLTPQSEDRIEQVPLATPAPSPTKIKLRCSSCQKWFELERYAPTQCPTCNRPLKIAIQCEDCKNWFSVSKPGKYNCPKCKKLIDCSNF